MTSPVTYRATSYTALSVNEFQVRVTVLFSHKSKVILRDVILVLSGTVWNIKNVVTDQLKVVLVE